MSGDNNLEIKKKQNGMASALALVTLGIYVLLNKELFFSNAIINAIAIFISGIGLAIFAFSVNDKIKNTFGSALFLVAIYAPFYYLNIAEQWPLVISTIIHLVGLVVVFLSAGLFWFGVTTVVTSIYQLFSKEESEEEKGKAKKSLFSSLSQIGSLVLLILQIVIAFKSLQ